MRKFKQYATISTDSSVIPSDYKECVGKNYTLYTSWSHAYIVSHRTKNVYSQDYNWNSMFRNLEENPYLENEMLCHGGYVLYLLTYGFNHNPLPEKKLKYLVRKMDRLVSQIREISGNVAAELALKDFIYALHRYNDLPEFDDYYTALRVYIRLYNVYLKD